MVGILKSASGFSWCSTHDNELPCEACDNLKLIHPFLGLCFDCKRENAGKEERDAEHCSCGAFVRLKSQYRYP